MRIFAETERLILREIVNMDVDTLFEMDSDPLVHTYLGNNPIRTKKETATIIDFIRKQYAEYGIGRWAAVEKQTGNFIGWSGLKYITEVENNHINFYDVGYRFMPKYWGKGFATESAKAAIRYGFEMLKTNEIYGIAHINNIASRKALENCGLRYIESFNWKDMTCDWLKITYQEWINK